MIDPIEFRRVMGHFATGVTVVTTRTSAGGPCGLTANAFTSVSIDPLLVLVCVAREANSHDCIVESGAFAINVLAQEGGESLARRFASWDLEAKFDGVAYREERTGSPVFPDALAWLDCRVHQEVPAGDHTLFLGEVLAADAREGTPLLYYRGGYGRFTP